ncbi:potassium channel subfamily K member 6 [Astyanax mexicanus]|uniref:potassium channel subfamily K member 6 n=1 Tax=Astyanax mexicanus TaxID=7994 RepID=UPI0020CAD684|nr:potassium channel subfamily K member 6 [Astyanax mexicanus]
MSPFLRSFLLLGGLVLAYVVYLLLGALVFSAIERPVEDSLHSELSSLKAQILQLSCINASTLEDFLEKVLRANKYGVSVLRNVSVGSNWDLASSLFFANTLVTTVGYGHTTPLSDAGKAFSIVYALFGVPFTMLVLTACVQRLMRPLTYKPIAFWQQRSGWQPHVAATGHFIILLLVVVLAFFVLPAVIFSTIEESWSFLEAFYFCFISLCTIGLGDFVPGEQPDQSLRPLYKISVMVYLFVGLMVMYLVLRTFHKLADLQGWTSFFHLPHCEDELEEDKEPIVEAVNETKREEETAASKHLDPGSHVSYNSISR